MEWGCFFPYDEFVLAAIQLPFVDVRPFLANEGGKLLRPPWPLLNSTRADFVRYLGPTRDRRLGGLDPWPGEEAYCDASRAVRFSSSLAKSQFGTSRSATGFRCSFRRFLHNGEAVARFDLGLTRSSHPRLELSATDVDTMLHALLGYQMTVRTTTGLDTASLGRLGAHLAELLLRATTKSSFASEVQQWWFQPLTPLVILEYHTGQLLSPSNATPVIGRPQSMTDLPCALAYYRVIHDEQTCGVWLIERIAHRWRSDVVRNLRVHLQRLHAEFETLNRILGLIIEEQLPLQRGEPTAKLLGYIGAASGLLSRSTVYGNPQSPLLRAAYSFSEIATPGRQATLMATLRKVRPAVADRMERLTSLVDVDVVSPQS